MQAAEARRAVAAARSAAAALGLAVDDAAVLNDSNRLVAHLTPCDVVARVTPVTHPFSASRELDVVGRLAQTAAPVARPDARVPPQVVVRDSFEITMWTYVEPVAPRPLPPADYARALTSLHAGLRQIEVPTPHVLDRIAATREDAVSRDVTPDLADADRELLVDTLGDLGRSIAAGHAPEQLLHGEPHPWNVLDTADGLLFIDFENTARGPVEYDLAWVPEEVSERVQGVDQDLVGRCRGVALAIVVTHRWRRDDRHPSGRPSGVAFLDVLRNGPPWPAIPDVDW